MASSQGPNSTLVLLLIVATVAGLAQVCMGSSRKLAALVQPTPVLLEYHGGAVLQGDIPVSILWYGVFTSSQKSIISDLLLSLTPSQKQPSPSVSQWWSTVDDLYLSKATHGKKRTVKTRVLLASQISDEKCSMGKSLKRSQLPALAARAGAKQGGIALVLTARDVAVQDFCMSSCGTHGSDAKNGAAYVWVGDSSTQCPGQCAWPFHQPEYGPQTPPMTAPNGDVGADGMAINVAALVAAAATNPFKDGFYQGARDAPLEVGSACTGVYAKGAYPGYPGDLLVDHTTGASYNAIGAHGRKYVLPALVDPSTAQCSTLV